MSSNRKLKKIYSAKKQKNGARATGNGTKRVCFPSNDLYLLCKSGADASQKGCKQEWVAEHTHEQREKNGKALTRERPKSFIITFFNDVAIRENV